MIEGSPSPSPDPLSKLKLQVESAGGRINMDTGLLVVGDREYNVRIIDTGTGFDNMTIQELIDTVRYSTSDDYDGEHLRAVSLLVAKFVTPLLNNVVNEMAAKQQKLESFDKVTVSSEGVIGHKAGAADTRVINKKEAAKKERASTFNKIDKFMQRIMKCRGVMDIESASDINSVARNINGYISPFDEEEGEELENLPNNETLVETFSYGGKKYYIVEDGSQEEIENGEQRYYLYLDYENDKYVELNKNAYGEYSLANQSDLDEFTQYLERSEES